jgi:hypothetical protein
MTGPIRPEEIIVLFFVSVSYLGLVFLCLARIPRFEVKLIALGLLTALVAVWCGQLAGGELRGVVAAQGTGTLGRIAFVLVLGGVAVGVLSRCNDPSAPSNSEETPRANSL